MNNDNPITKVYLLDVPLESDYKNTLYFTSKSAQQTYFQSCIVESYTDFTYQRKDKIIRIPDIYDNIYHCNYVMYQNSNYSNKWFYCFIDKMEYINDGRTDITIQTDVIQTWLFDYEVKPSFVEREHVSNDTIGLHTIPEGLETGPFTQVSIPTKINHYNETYICIGVSELLPQMTPQSEQKLRLYNGVFSGLYYIVCNNPVNASNLTLIYDMQGKKDAIYTIFLIPPEFIYNTGTPMYYDTISYEGIAVTCGYLTYSTTYTNILRDSQNQMIEYKDVPMNQNLGGGYVPRNNKLFTGEFNYMVLTNNAGSDVKLNYEDFLNRVPRFKAIGAITPGGSTKCIPVNYKTGDGSDDIDSSYNFGINGGKFPICSWSSDSYTNWLTQNGVNIAVSTTANVAAAVGGIALASTGFGALIGAGMVASGVKGIADTMTQAYQQSLVPDQAKGNVNSGDVTYSAKQNVFSVYQMAIKYEYAEIIDKFMDMFGYKVNIVKIPNKAHRSRWWYTKTIDVNIDGAIPNDDMQTIKNAYNNGITFWRNASEIQNYNLTNGIV